MLDAFGPRTVCKLCTTTLMLHQGTVLKSHGHHHYCGNPASVIRLSFFWRVAWRPFRYSSFKLCLASLDTQSDTSYEYSMGAGIKDGFSNCFYGR
jgi:hypothetical protein